MDMIHAHKCECGTVERVLCDVADCPKVDKCNKCSGVSALIEAAAQAEEIFAEHELEAEEE